MFIFDPREREMGRVTFPWLVTRTSVSEVIHFKFSLVSAILTKI